jgi:hypothetical protein
LPIAAVRITRPSADGVVTTVLSAAFLPESENSKTRYRQRGRQEIDRSLAGSKSFEAHWRQLANTFDIVSVWQWRIRVFGEARKRAAPAFHVLGVDRKPKPIGF